MLERIRQWVEALKRDVIALWFAYRHPDTPWYAKLWVAMVVGYALSPIDLIPDFIPVLGYLDEMILLPAGIWVALKLIPAHALEAGRVEARDWVAQRRAKPRNLYAAGVIVALWLLALGAVGYWIWR